MIAQMLNLVRRSRGELINHYLYTLQDELQPVSRVELSPDPRKLLSHAEHNGDSPVDVRRRFEALHFFDLSCGFAEIELTDPENHAREDLDNLVELFEKELFHDSGDFTVWTVHEPKRYRVTDFAVGRKPAGEFIRENPFTCRLIRSVSGPVFFHHRVKYVDSTWLKIQKQVADAEIREPHKVWDRRAVLFVVESDEAMSELIASLRHVIERHGGKFFDDLRAVKGHPPNRHTAKDYAGLQMGIYWRGQTYEVQLYLFDGWVDANWSLDTVNHELYRLRQLITFYCPQILFPSAVYRTVDWVKDEELQQMLMMRQVARLGWRLDPRRLHTMMQPLLGDS
jgi:hypothetical protein